MGWIVLLGIYFIPPIIAAIVVYRRGVKMDQKRLAGMVVCNIVFIITFLVSLLVAFAAIFLWQPGGNEAIRWLFVFFPTIVSISIIGLWHRQKWGRIFSLFVATVVFIFMANSFYGSLFSESYETALQSCAYAATFAVIGIGFIGIICYLTRPKVKEQFK